MAGEKGGESGGSAEVGVAAEVRSSEYDLWWVLRKEVIIVWVRGEARPYGGHGDTDDEARQRVFIGVWCGGVHSTSRVCLSTGGRGGR